MATLVLMMTSQNTNTTEVIEMSKLNESAKEFKLGVAVKRKLESEGFTCNEETKAWENELNEFKLYAKAKDSYMVVKGDGVHNDFRKVQEAIDFVRAEQTETKPEKKSKKKNDNIVILEIAGYEIEVEVEKTGNRKLDIANALAWLVKEDEIIEGDEEFAEEVKTWITGTANDLIEAGNDKSEWIPWASLMNDELALTLKRTIAKPKKPKGDPFIILFFDEYEITTPIRLTKNYKNDLAEAYDWIASDKEIIDGDREFANDLSKRIKGLEKEFDYAKLPIGVIGGVEYASWNEWAKAKLDSIESYFVPVKKTRATKKSKMA